MSFLTLHGLTIPVAKGGDGAPDDIGSRERAFSGALLTDRRATKETWKFRTAPVNAVDADRIRRVIRGEGQYWPFDTDLYSSKGLPASTGAATATLLSCTAADASPVIDGKFTGSVTVSAASENILDADSRDAENAPTGYWAVDGAAIAGSTTHKWHGTKSVTCTTSAAVNSVFGGLKTLGYPAAGNAGHRFFGSVYVKCVTAGLSVTIQLKDEDTSALGTARTYTLTDANTWYRCAADILIGGVDTTTIGIYVLEGTVDSGMYFACDGFQLEKDRMTAWVDGTRASSEHLDYAWPAQDDSDFTINCWVRAPITGGLQRIVTFGSAAAWSTSIVTLSIHTAGNAYVSHYHDTVNTPLSSVAIPGWMAMTMLTVIGRRVPKTGEHGLELYINGVYDNGASPPVLMHTSLADLVEVGQRGVADHFGGWIDCLQVLPYGATAAQIAAWYARTSEFAGLPRLDAEGAFTLQPSETVEGVVKGGAYAGFMDNGVWTAAGRVLDFELEQV